MTGALAFLLSLAAGWCFVTAFLARQPMRNAWTAHVIRAALGAGAGVAISSGGFFLLLLAGAASATAVVVLNVALLAGGLVSLWLARRRAAALPPSAVPPSFRWNWLLALALAAGLALVLVGLISCSAANPLGEWDAWSIWNLRAKFLAGAGDAWRNALSTKLEGASQHPDYPLLVSGFVAMIWKASGDTAPWVPQLTGFLFLGLVLALLASALAALRSLTSALVAGLVLLSSTSFLFLATMQYADLPLSFYFLASLTLLVLAETPDCLALSGAFASMAAWTKNEGAAFAVLLTLAILAVEWRAAGLRCALDRSRRFLTGAAPGLLLVLGFKLFLAPASEPLFNQSAAHLKLADPSRYVQIGKALVVELYNLGQPWSHPLLLLAILALALRFRIDAARVRAWRASAAAVALAFAAYCVVYLVTPSDLASLPRLYAQLWPSFLLLAFLALNMPGAAGPAEPRASAARTEPRASASGRRSRK
jgi:hypothetical protein